MIGLCIYTVRLWTILMPKMSLSVDRSQLSKKHLADFFETQTSK